MANKIPVGATIARSYDFTFRNFLANVGAIWMPFLVMSVGGLFLMKAELPFIMKLFSFNFAAAQSKSGPSPEMLKLMNEMSALGPYMSLGMFLMAACFSSMCVGLTREALELRKGNAFLQMPFNKPVWILIGAYLILMLIFLGLYFGIIIFFLLLVGLAALVGHLAGSASTFLPFMLIPAAIAGWCAMIFAMFRLSFLMMPLVVAEESISFRRGWRLTRGNFWRIFVIWLAVYIPLLLASFGYVLFMLGGDLFPPVAAVGNPQVMAAWFQHYMQMLQHLLELRLHWWFLYFPLELVFFAIFYGLSVGSHAFAYQALIKDEAA